MYHIINAVVYITFLCMNILLKLYKYVLMEIRHMFLVKIMYT